MCCRWCIRSTRRVWGPATCGNACSSSWARAGREDSRAFGIVGDHLDDLLKHRWAEISKASGISVAEVQEVADEVATLDPRPGRQYASSPDQYVIPDLIVDKVGGDYMVFANDTGLPRLRLSRTYRDVAAKRSSFAGENKEFISSRMNAAAVADPDDRNSGARRCCG